MEPKRGRSASGAIHQDEGGYQDDGLVTGYDLPAAESWQIP